MSMSTNTGGLRQNLPSTFKDNAPNGGRPQTGQSLANMGQAGLGGRPQTMPQQSYDQYSKAIFGNQGGQYTPEFTTMPSQPIGDDNPIVPGDTGESALRTGGMGFGKGGGFGPGMVPGGGGGKSMPSPGIQPIFGQPGEAPPDPGFIKSPQPTLPPQMQKPMPGPGYVGGIRTPPSNYRPPNQGGGILRSRRTGMPITNRPAPAPTPVPTAPIQNNGPYFEDFYNQQTNNGVNLKGDVQSYIDRYKSLYPNAVFENPNTLAQTA